MTVFFSIVTLRFFLKTLLLRLKVKKKFIFKLRIYNALHYTLRETYELFTDLMAKKLKINSSVMVRKSKVINERRK